MAELDDLPSFTVTTFEKTGSKVVFEPLGVPYHLEYSDILTVRTAGLLTGDVDVVYGEGRIVVCFNSVDEAFVTNKEGQRIDVG